MSVTLLAGFVVAVASGSLLLLTFLRHWPGQALAWLGGVAGYTLAAIGSTDWLATVIWSLVAAVNIAGWLTYRQMRKWEARVAHLEAREDSPR